MNLKRIVEEFKQMNTNPITNCGVTVGLFDENDYTKWRVTLIGPKDSSYVNGVFILSIIFPYEYPQKRPEVCFLTPIYHINVKPTAPKTQEDEPLGHVCISTLNWWKPYYKIKQVITDIFALFYLGNPESPYGVDRAEEFKENRDIYEEKVKHFTKKYAHPLNQKNDYDRTKDWNFNP